MFTRFSLATIGIVAGGILTIIGILAYCASIFSTNLAGFFASVVGISLGSFFYGFPLFLGGLAFKITELKPAPYLKETTPEVEELRKNEATNIQKQVRSDVTRYRYGQDSHLDFALAKIGLGTKEEELPILTGLYEEKRHGHYALVLEFDSPLLNFEKWEERHSKIESFFGPDIKAELEDLGEERRRMALISNPAA